MSSTKKEADQELQPEKGNTLKKPKEKVEQEEKVEKEVTGATLKKKKNDDAEIPAKSSSISDFVKSEKTKSIAGLSLLIAGLYLLIAFTSYLFTWEEDQDKVFKNGYKLLLGTDVKVANLLGTLGAFIAHFFIYNGFGIAAYLVCSFFFIIGINFFFGKKIFSTIRNLKYLIVGLPLLSVLASVLFSSKAFAWGGAVGDITKEWMYKVIGEIGTYGILLLAAVSYIIWRFNPVFKLPQKNQVEAGDISNQLDEVDDEDESTSLTTTENQDDVISSKSNVLKEEGINGRIYEFINPIIISNQIFPQGNFTPNVRIVSPKSKTVISSEITHQVKKKIKLINNFTFQKEDRNLSKRTQDYPKGVKEN